MPVLKSTARRARHPEGRARCHTYNRDMPRHRRTSHRQVRRPVVRESPTARLAEAERLFADFVELTPYKFTPFVKTFDSFDEYERWKRAQTNPWYR